MKILVTKTHKLKEDDNPDTIEIVLNRYVEFFVTRWIDRNDIIRVKNYNSDETITTLADWNIQLSDVKVAGTNTLRAEVYFTVETGKRLWEIVEKDRAEYKQENVWIEVKHTGEEHINRVGYLTRPIVDRANLDSYDTMMKYLGKIGDREVEIKKNMVYEGSECEWCITVHSMKLIVEKVDFGLRKMSAENQTHMKYISFKNSTKADRIAGLKLN